LKAAEGGHLGQAALSGMARDESETAAAARA